jgi:hypothetical protein
VKVIPCNVVSVGTVDAAIAFSTPHTWFAASVQVPGGLTAIQALLSLSKLQTENNSDDGKKQVLRGGGLTISYFSFFPVVKERE